MKVDTGRKGTHIGEGDHIRSFVGALVATQLHDVNVGVDLEGKLCERKSIECPSAQTHSSIQPTVPLR
jgi:hypothetical protein